ncbi:phage tail tape measure protein [Avibacterium volantium]|uniref:phage tail tape measure protein n=1 Tax=Avibacterium volantium TaxID=762 RepID=UPI003BF805BC
MTDFATLGIKITSTGAAKAENELGRLERQSVKVDKSIESVIKTIDKLRNYMTLGFLGVGINQLLQMSDKMKTLATQVRFVTQTTAEYERVQQSLFEISQQTRASLEATTTIYTRTSRALKDYGYSQQQVLTFTETLNKAMAVGGVGAQEQATALFQLSQALGSGRLQGDEFRTIAEAAPIILDVVAEYMGKSRAEIKKLAADGVITSKIIFEAISGANKKISQQFEGMPITFGQAMQQMENAVLKFVDEMLNGSGVTNGLAEAVSFLAKNFDALVKAVGYATAAYIAYNTVSYATNFKQAHNGVGMLAMGFGHLTQMVRGATIALMANPIGALTVAIVGAAYVFDQFISDMQVGASTVELTWGDVAHGVWEDFKDVVSDTGKWFVEYWDKSIASAGSSFDSLLGTVISVSSHIATTFKNTANLIIGLFIGAYKSSVIAWNNFPAALEALAVVAFNGLVILAEKGINALIELIKAPIELINAALQKFGGEGFDTSAFRANLDGFKLTASEQAKNVGENISSAFMEGLDKDYIGGAFKDLQDYLIKTGIDHKANPKESVDLNQSGVSSVVEPNDTKGGGKKREKALREWRDYYNQLEITNGTAWDKIVQEENRALREMLDKAKRANVGYEEIEKARKLITEKYLKERKDLAAKYAPELKFEEELENSLKEIEQLKKAGMLTNEQAGMALLSLGEKYNPVLAAQREYIQNMKEIEALKGKGILTENQADFAKQEQEFKRWLAQADHSDPFDGMILGIKRFGDKATDVMGNVAQITETALDGMTDQLTNFVLTGKADFRSLAVSILSDITKMIVKMMIFNAIKAGASAMGYSIPGFDSGGYVEGYSSGGYTGNGGKYDPAGVVHKGEYVLTKEATARLGVDYLDYLNYGKSKRGFATGGGVNLPTVHTQSSSPKISVKVINNGEPTEAKVDSKQDEKGGLEITVELMRSVAREETSKMLQSNMRPGGMFA